MFFYSIHNMKHWLVNWNNHTCLRSFAITAQKLLNCLSITEFDSQRLREFKTWCLQLFLLQEIESWQMESYLKGYVPWTAVSSLPRPALPFNESAFTFTNTHLNTPGRNLTLPFIKTFPRSHLWLQFSIKSTFQIITFHRYHPSSPIFIITYHLQRCTDPWTWILARI